MTDEWMLPEETWRNMKEDQKRQHRISVRAYFLSLEREQNGTPGSPEDDWAAAEQEELRREEALECLTNSRETHDRSERIRYAALYQLSCLLKIRPSLITDETPIPSDQKVREELGVSLGWNAMYEIFRIPKDVTTAGALIEALNKTQKVPRQIRWLSLG